MTYDEAEATRDGLDAVVRDTSAALQAFPRGGPMGLVPDDVRTSPAYQAAKARYATAFERLRQFNAFYVRQFNSEIRAERTAEFRRRAPKECPRCGNFYDHRYPCVG